jgi:hypothetical protein
MKISELIEKLFKHKENFGDVEVLNSFNPLERAGKPTICCLEMEDLVKEEKALILV